jgi:hypothetical protein
MDDNRFDRLSQTLAHTSLRSRRSILATLGAALVGALTSVDSEAASAKKSRHHTRHKGRHADKPRRHGGRGPLRATRSRKPDSRCEPLEAGAACEEAFCIDEITFQPACACDGDGQCNCPPAVTCPHHLACQKGACLSSCAVETDCAKGATCDTDGKCTDPRDLPHCDCANLNFCSGHGSCTPECTCVCDAGWLGAACDARPTVRCSDHVTCQECSDDVYNGCVFCRDTLAGASGVCVTSDQCLIPQDGC